MGRTHRMVASVATLALACSLAAGSAQAAPGEDDVEASRAAERATSGRIADLEIRLAEVGARAQNAITRSAEANAGYAAAQTALDTTAAAAVRAQEEADAAAVELEAAREDLGQIGAALYREGAASLSPLAPFLSAESLDDAVARSSTLDRLGRRAESQVQSFSAVQQVHDTLARRAEEARAAQEAATRDLADAAREADSAATSAQTQLNLAGEARAGLIAQLAEQRSTTVELEKARQDELDRERSMRLEAQAQAEVLANVAQIRESAPASRSDDTHQTPPPAAPPAGGSAPAPQAPAPTAPSPAPAVPAPAPAPAPAPDPVPVPRPTPAPKPTPVPAPGVPGQKVDGASLVAYARQFQGTPYVWGGHTPAAFDCAGFTWYVYRHFGISIPLSSWGQGQIGTRISAAEARPGDLVWWPGHVGIYTGNGNYISALNPRMPLAEAPIRLHSSSWTFIRV